MKTAIKQGKGRKAAGNAPARGKAGIASAAPATGSCQLREARCALSLTRRDMAIAMDTPLLTYRYWEAEGVSNREPPGCAVKLARLLVYMNKRGLPIKPSKVSP